MGSAQDCTLKIEGRVIDEHDNQSLEKAVLELKEVRRFLTTDASGNFLFTGLCAGTYHLKVSHVGCTPREILVQLRRDTFFTITMDHHVEHLEAVRIAEQVLKQQAKPMDRLEGRELSRLAHKSFSEVVEELPGVNTLRTGSGVAKPIVQGLFGNRVALVSNGVPLGGQQWGNDHAPEIDPFMAQSIQVLNGASALRYGGGNLGSVVELVPKAFGNDPHVHGLLNYTYSSNGRGHTLNAMAEQSSKFLNWRTYATYKNAGDLHTPDYYLSNTGRREANWGLQLNKTLWNKWIHDFNYTLFTTELGLLRGSHIGNLTDLEIALTRDEPFFTRDDFSRKIERPSQEVQHHQWAYESKYRLNDRNLLLLKSSVQWNRRREYDVRRGDRSDIPALSLSQYTFWNELGHILTTQNTEWQSGFQYQSVNNSNVPETGILPLIPDYFQDYVAAYSTYKQKKGAWTYEAGARAGITAYQAFTITQTLPREVRVYDLSFYHAAAVLAADYQWNEKNKIGVQLGYTLRPPEIHELFSFGLHQGVSSIEEGDPNLQPESSLKTSLNWEYRPSKKMYFSVNTFYQRVDDFIYLQPQEQFRLTIRGAFPVFVYEQQDASLLGGELYFRALITDHLHWTGSYSAVRGYNLGLDMPLVYMPSDVIRSALQYEWVQWGVMKQPAINLQARYVYEQTRLLAEQDFLAPPSAYFLLGVNFSTGFMRALKNWNVNLRIENLLNARYRDYLNRQRYFSDEMGINVMLGVGYRF